ncbi:MAG TPA: hypothetical protein VF121_01290 [Thermoanaerobaculia bacterium]|nr:hypothetical protein [Thermoanaerobaculia bacterium]
MTGLAILLLAFTPVFVPVPDDVAAAAPCAAAREIALQRPCLRAEECGAVEEWRRLFGEPGVRPLPSQPAARRALAATSFVCPAAPGR